MQKPLLIITFIALSLLSFSQGTYIPLGSDAYDYVDRLDIKYAKIMPLNFTSDKGYERAKVARLAETLLLSNLKFNKVQRAQLQYLVDENAEWLDSLHSKTRTPLFKKLYTEPASFFSVSSKKKGLFDLRINPMLAVNVGGESEMGRFVFSRSVGLEVRGNIKKVLSFYLNVTGNDERTPYYVYAGAIQKSSFSQYAHLPGESYWKEYNSKLFKFNGAVDYFDARGYVKANILKYVNLTFGRDKFFIGDGQRSLILSDNAAPFLFLKFDIDAWRFKYQNIFAQLTGQYLRGGDALLPIKYMAIHHLSLSATHWLTLGIFETVIFQRSQFDFSYLNPIIFYKSVEHSLGNPDKMSVGGDFKVNMFHHMSFYGQILFNEFSTAHFFKNDGWWANKWALQFGLKYIDIVPNLDGQIEFNVVRPFTYTGTSSTDNFTSYNQPLADPLGASFYEIVFNLHFQPIPKLSFNAKYWVAKVGGDTLLNGSLTDYGSNIFIPANDNNGNPNYTRELHNKLAQGATGTINYFELLTSYKPWHNISIDADIVYRSKTTVKSPNNYELGSSTFIFSIGARMNIAYNQRKYQF